MTIFLTFLVFFYLGPNRPLKPTNRQLLRSFSCEGNVGVSKRTQTALPNQSSQIVSSLEDQTETDTDSAETIKISKKPLFKIFVKTTNKEKQPWITGMTVLSPDTLLLADFENNSVKRYDLEKRSFKPEIKMENSPWDITALSHERAAVTLPDDRSIRIIFPENPSVVSKKVKTTNKCYGVSFVAEKLVVSYICPSMVEIMDFHGNVLKTVERDEENNPLFKTPEYVTVSMEVIYVSDFENVTIAKLNLEGKVLHTIKDRRLRCPRGIAVAGNNLLVCNSDKGFPTLELITENRRVITLLSNKNVTNIPQTVCYCSSRHLLCVSTNVKGLPVRVFNWSR